jgi:hypothetical protein
MEQQTLQVSVNNRDEKNVVNGSLEEQSGCHMTLLFVLKKLPKLHIYNDLRDSFEEFSDANQCREVAFVPERGKSRKCFSPRL